MPGTSQGCSSLAKATISRTFAATGRFMWHDEPIDATLSLSDFVAALVGDRSGLKVRFSGTPVKLAFDGYVSYSPTLRMEGTLAADGPSLRDALRWATHRAPRSPLRHTAGTSDPARSFTSASFHASRNAIRYSNRSRSRAKGSSTR